MDNVWIGGNGQGDSHVLKFTKDGKFLAQYGKPGARKISEKDGQPVFKRNSSDPESFGRVAKIGIDAAANEAYIADGYFNRRIAVLDVDTGKIKRFWGAFGKPPDDGDLPRYTAGETSQQTFRGPVHCSEISKDGLVYVCDRNADRIQIFRKDGTFVSEHIVAPATLSQGSTWDIDFSHDPEQRFIYLADGQNMKVYIIERKTMKVLTAFGDGGRQPGHVLRGPQHRGGQQGQHLHDGNLRRLAPPALHLQGHGPGARGRRRREEPGRALAGRQALTTMWDPALAGFKGPAEAGPHESQSGRSRTPRKSVRLKPDPHRTQRRPPASHPAGVFFYYPRGGERCDGG